MTHANIKIKEVLTGRLYIISYNALGYPKESNLTQNIL